MRIDEGIKLAHIGYAVADIERYLTEFFIPLFRPYAVSSVVEDPLQRVRIAFVTLTGGAEIELIQPLDVNSPVSKLLEAKRGGLYHLCYWVDDIESQIGRFREKGFLPISGPTPATAFQGRQVAFLMTPQRDVIELVETRGTSNS